MGSLSEAIATLGQQDYQSKLHDRSGISVKLSALHPLYEYTKQQQVMDALLPRLLVLVLAAKAAHISITIDAEETDRLDLALDLFEAVYRDDRLNGWNGLGMAVQAYQKRAIHVIDWLAQLAREYTRSIPVRLVKGAYWDNEIKLAQERGLRIIRFLPKAATDISFLLALDA